MNTTIPLAGINIVTHPHSPGGYVELLLAMFAERRHVPMRGAQHLMFGEIRPISDSGPEDGLFGRLYRFVFIDRDASWFNVSRHDEATPEELSKINLPEELRPNTETFDFVFYPKGHSFYFNMRSGNKVNGKHHALGVGQVVKLLKTLAALPSIENRFGVAEITAFPAQEQLEKILSIHSLGKLLIEVSKPNPDELGQAQAKVFGRLAGMKARKLRQELVAEKNESIAVDDDTRTLAQVAASNGKVVGYGYTVNHQKVEESTLAKPWTERVPYDSDIQSEADALISAAADLPGHG